jgi:hypothetical protein
MPQTRLASRVVFGGGGGGGSSEPAPTYKSSYPELKGKVYNSKADRDAAEKAVDNKKADNKTIKDYKAAIKAAVAAVPGEGVDAIGKLQQQIQAASGVAVPGLKDTERGTELTNALKATVDVLQGQLREAQTQRMTEMSTATREMTQQAITDPSQLVTTADVAKIDPNAAGTTIAEGTGQVGEAATMDVTTAGPAAVATTAAPITAETVTAETTGQAVGEAMQDVAGVQGTVSPEAIAQAATMDPTQTAVGNLQEAQGTAIMMQNPVQREIQAGELISGVADAQKAVAFTEQIQAAQATPSEQTMVKTQLDNLMQDFEGGATPAWAAGAMRAATSAMAARGLGASSMAGQAIVQATMESALPIAMADAQTIASFEMQNLSNRQQRAMLAAEQRAAFIGQEFDQAFQARVQNASRIADVANMNFTAEQQIALENSRAANTMNLANLSNSQAMVMAQAAAISQLEQQNLSNQQQAAVQNANAFLAMDMQNLTNQQQAEMFKAQTIAQSIFTDAAAENAARQFNASSENQTKQFMANMQTQVSQFNAAQINAQNQFNAGQANAASQFNAQVQNQRDQFNAQNALVVAQANAQWRQNVQTINTAAQNEANMMAAQVANGITTAALDQMWQRERDIMDYSFKASESSKERALQLVLADKKYDEYAKARADAEETAMWATLANIVLS